MTDLTLPAERASRDRLADRTDVLDKVKALRALPGDMHVTRNMVASYFEVPESAVNSLVHDNRDELTSDGVRLASPEELSSLKEQSAIDRRTPSLALYPRRAVLRIGMLLRDSEIAKAVRTALLDIEQRTTTPAERMALAVLEAQQIIAATTERAEIAEHRVAELEPAALSWQQMVEQKGTVDFEIAAKLLCQAGITIGRTRLFALCRERRWINKKNRPYQPTVERGYLTPVPTGDAWVDEDGIKHIKTQTCFTPRGLERMRQILLADQNPESLVAS